jgi:hypothetical protein
MDQIRCKEPTPAAILKELVSNWYGQTNEKSPPSKKIAGFSIQTRDDW